MKVLTFHNRYRFPGGEESVVAATESLLQRRGVVTRTVFRDSADLQGVFGKARAFGSGIYSLAARRDAARTLREETPDVVHVHNLYPLFSPSILTACRQAGIPVVMTCHNYRLSCPISLHLSHGEVCEECTDGREHRCIVRNCRENMLESVGYALRSIVARKLRLFHRNVTVLVALSQFAKRRFVAAGFEEDRIAVLPNMVPLPDTATDPGSGDYVAFAGRLSGEKGAATLLAAARQAPQLRVRFAGDGPLLETLKAEGVSNAEFLGRLNREQMVEFYRGARLLVLPSEWYEMCPVVLSEAMSHGLPVVASRMGGLPEIVEDEVTGRLFEAGDPRDLAAKMRSLWSDPELCRRMGAAGRRKAAGEYGEETYYERLMAIYELARRGPAATTARNPA